MKKPKKVVRQVIAALIGFPLLIVGIILIPLPGPGILVCFLALLVLAREFEWAERHAERLKKQLGKLTKRVKKEVETDIKKEEKKLKKR